MLNMSNVVLTLEKSSSIVCLYFEHLLVSNDCVTDTTRHSTWSAGLLFCVEFELNLQHPGVVCHVASTHCVMWQGRALNFPLPSPPPPPCPLPHQCTVPP